MYEKQIYGKSTFTGKFKLGEHLNIEEKKNSNNVCIIKYFLQQMTTMNIHDFN